jgi:hypothetical protein
LAIFIGYLQTKARWPVQYGFDFGGKVKEQLATTTTAGTGVREAVSANLSVDMLICIDAHHGSSDSAGRG